MIVFWEGYQRWWLQVGNNEDSILSLHKWSNIWRIDGDYIEGTEPNRYLLSLVVSYLNDPALVELEVGPESAAEIARFVDKITRLLDRCEPIYVECSDKCVFRVSQLRDLNLEVVNEIQL